MEELHNKVERLHSWYEDNGAWGAKTKLAQLWDWMVSTRDIFKKHTRDIEKLSEELNSKIDSAVCDVKHDKLLHDIEKMLDVRDRNWKYWFEQIKWLVPTIGLIAMYLHQNGFIVNK